jgi:hypothetical protein
MGLPLVVIPCVQPDFMSVQGNGPDHFRTFSADHGSWKQGPSEKDIPSIKAWGMGPDHFFDKSGPQQLEQMPPHIVRSHTKEKGCRNPVRGKYLLKVGNTDFCAPVSVHIDSQS